MQSTTKLSVVQSENGSLIRHSERAAVHPEIPPGLLCSNETIIALLAVVKSLIGHTTSTDVMYLVLRAAWNEASRLGVPQDDFDKVQLVVVNEWLRRYKR